MGSINSMLSSYFTTSSQTSTLPSTFTDRGSSGINTFGQAFQISLTQQQNADGSDSDNVSFEAYSASGNTASMTVATGNGDSAQSAFEAMLSSMSPADTNVLTIKTVPLSELFNQLDSSLGSSSGTVTVAGGELLTKAGTTGNTEPDGSSDAMTQFVNSVINSLETSLDTLSAATSATGATGSAKT